jgi:hypothetical protein
VYSGDLYGTLREEILQKRVIGPVLLDIDVRGAHSVKKCFGDEAFVIFVKPPSLDILIKRLVERGTENPASLQKRIDRIEMAHQRAVVVHRVQAFEPFQRGEGGDGSGLGLHVVRTLTQAHGGEAWLAPADGGGLVAIVSIPAAST